MELAVDTFTVSVDQFEGVRAVAIHVTVAIRQTSITEQERHLHGRHEATDDIKACQVSDAGQQIITANKGATQPEIVYYFSKMQIPDADSQASDSRSPTPCQGPSCGFEGCASGNGWRTETAGSKNAVRSVFMKISEAIFARFLLDLNSPAERPWWRKWGCCCRSGPSCPLQCKTWRQSPWGLGPCPPNQTPQLQRKTIVVSKCLTQQNLSSRNQGRENFKKALLVGSSVYFGSSFHDSGPVSDREK